MDLRASGLSHIAFRVSDLGQAKRFYVDTLGFQPVIEEPQVLLVFGYGILLGLLVDQQSTMPGDRFNPFRIGLDHIALIIKDRETLEVVKRDLDAAGVRNNGLEIDPLTHSTYLSFYDPDGIAWELYILPQR